MDTSGLLSKFEAELCIDLCVCTSVCVCRMCFYISVLTVLVRAAQSSQILRGQRRQSSHQLQRRNTYRNHTCTQLASQSPGVTEKHQTLPSTAIKGTAGPIVPLSLPELCVFHIKLLS